MAPRVLAGDCSNSDFVPSLVSLLLYFCFASCLLLAMPGLVKTPEVVKKGANKPAPSSGWSYNLRSAAFCSDSDSSETSSPTHAVDTDATSSQPAISDDASLLKELDLSSRHDEAVFKPNPWTIARANAGSRTAVTPGATRSNKPARNGVPTGPIVQAFKKQAQQRPTKQRSSAHAVGTDAAKLRGAIKPHCDSPAGVVPPVLDPSLPGSGTMEMETFGGKCCIVCQPASVADSSFSAAVSITAPAKMPLTGVPSAGRSSQIAQGRVSLKPDDVFAKPQSNVSPTLDYLDHIPETASVDGTKLVGE